MSWHSWHDHLQHRHHKFDSRLATTSGVLSAPSQRCCTGDGISLRNSVSKYIQRISTDSMHTRKESSKGSAFK